jgi:Lrp/AsnC family leucine-responsive transcriptional regulator
MLKSRSREEKTKTSGPISVLKINKMTSISLDNKILDATNWRILQILQDNARISFAELAKLVNLTAPAVAERVRKMEAAGIITGYQARVNLNALGYGIIVLIQLAVPCEREKRLIEFLQGQAEVLECYNITGKDSFVIKVAVPSVARLEQVLEAISKFGQPTSHIVLSHTIPPRGVSPHPECNHEPNSFD